MYGGFGKACEGGAFQQALRVEHEVIFAMQLRPACGNLRPGFFVEHPSAPAPGGNGYDGLHPAMQLGDIGETFFHQPINMYVVQMGMNVGNDGQVMDDIAQ